MYCSFMALLFLYCWFGLYYFIIGKTDAFYFCYINSLIRLDYFNFLDLTSVLIHNCITFTLSALGVYQSVQHTIIYQLPVTDPGCVFLLFSYCGCSLDILEQKQWRNYGNVHSYIYLFPKPFIFTYQKVAGT